METPRSLGLGHNSQSQAVDGGARTAEVWRWRGKHDRSWRRGGARVVMEAWWSTVGRGGLAEYGRKARGAAKQRRRAAMADAARRGYGGAGGGTAVARLSNGEERARAKVTMAVAYERRRGK
jgi:hypothetical protein